MVNRDNGEPRELVDDRLERPDRDNVSGHPEQGRSGPSWLCRRVHGRVVSTTGCPVRNAVVTLLTPGGEQIDWGQVDSAGDFSVAVPGAGRYVVVAAADGWRPRSQMADLTAGAWIGSIVLPENRKAAGSTPPLATPRA